MVVLTSSSGPWPYGENIWKTSPCGARSAGPAYPWCAGQPSEDNACACKRWDGCSASLASGSAACAHKPAQGPSTGSSRRRGERHPSGPPRRGDTSQSLRPEPRRGSPTCGSTPSPPRTPGRPVERRVRKELDLNADGRVDIIHVFDADGQVSEETLDLDYDGKVDDTLYFEKGKRSARRRTSTATAGSTPGATTSNEKLVRKERDANGDGKVDYWEYWENGVRSTALARTWTATATSTAGPRAASRPPRGSDYGADGPGAPVRVLEPHDVVQLGGADLEDVAVGDGHHAVLGQRLDVVALAGLQLALDEALALRPPRRAACRSGRGLSRPSCCGTAATSLWPCVDVQQLAHVALGVGPDQLVAPGLLHPLVSCFIASCSPCRRDERLEPASRA